MSWADLVVFVVFFFNDTATTEIYTLSLHDALPIFWAGYLIFWGTMLAFAMQDEATEPYHILNAGLMFVLVLDFVTRDRKSTRLNSSHANISYAVFCLKKKIINHEHNNHQHERRDPL